MCSKKTWKTMIRSFADRTLLGEVYFLGNASTKCKAKNGKTVCVTRKQMEVLGKKKREHENKFERSNDVSESTDNSDHFNGRL